MAVPEWVETTIEAQAMVIQHWRNTAEQLNARVVELTKELATLKRPPGIERREPPRLSEQQGTQDGGEYEPTDVQAARARTPGRSRRRRTDN